MSNIYLATYGVGILEFRHFNPDMGLILDCCDIYIVIENLVCL